MNKQELLQRLKALGFSKNILDAFSKVKRENFIPEELEKEAYKDTALPIGHGQTISQPYTISIMLSELELKKGQNILEVGSGSGYVLALLSEIIGKNGKVSGIEVVKELVAKSKESLEDYNNIEIYHRNGSKGLPEKAPFDRILISAACREVPKELLNQLKDGGILLTPKGPRFEQSLVVIERQGNEFKTIREIPGFIFVPFIEGD
ncbi:MAG TPA: protein-L-isoaspartate(D-aspartate) O-methyltransferase [Bacillota bacterium]|nr:protein-L-isoaspartate(D-aspartate) O-methyltransferase [Bacillota bacterium]